MISKHCLLILQRKWDCVCLQNTLWPLMISGCRYQLSTTDVGIVLPSVVSVPLLNNHDMLSKEGSAAVCSEQPLVWTELFAHGGLDTCTLKDIVFPTSYPLKLSEGILNLTLMLLLKWNWRSFMVVLYPWLNCYGKLLSSLDFLR